MKQSFKEYVATRFGEIIATETGPDTKHDIIVLLGVNDFLDVSEYSANIVDAESFSVDGDASVFDEEDWFGRMFLGLRQPRELYLLSYQQFVYYTAYAPNLTKFKSRVVIVYDNVRSLFPIKKSAYLEKAREENIETRPDAMPIYQAEQVSIDGNTYCSFTAPTECRMVPFFTKALAIESSRKQCDDILEVDEHMYTLDVFLNRAFLDSRKKRVLGVKRVKDIIRADEFNQRLELANGLLSLLGAGEIIQKQETKILCDYIPRSKTVGLLKRYWGEKADFRQIKVYQNPGENNKVVAISQGQVVDLIIDEYRKCKETEEVADDVFITAPTGSGKSLLFQLPAFYVSEQGDVTVVVSPLIALMKDQVFAIRRDRSFEKVAYLNSELNLIDRDRIINQCKDGEIDILYMSPELLLSYDISYFIGERHLGLMVIDEAHLITTWGRDFRVDYWHLGNHINKIRKYRELRFPIVALTATCIYGGPNDMVIDSMGSLYMHNPHLFLGQVKRENIRFVINNYKSFEKGYRKNKTEQTVEFIKAANENHLKTVVYAPYTRHVRDIVDQVKDIAVPYYGTLSAEEKDFAYNRFKSNDSLIMVCTKAFGMGVDIPDIQVIYHHAPSGLLPDYVQEVGRVARDPDMLGFAALNYNEKDKQYSMQLFGMSSIRQWQIREVLKKIYSIYKLSNNQRNLLVSSEDFSYIFNDGDEDGTKVKTALMMIEKDYLTRIRYNAIIARPKQMFVKCYARTDAFGLSVLEKRYSKFYKKLRDLGGNQTVVELDLDEIWQQDFNDMTFSLLKREFYNGALLKKGGANLVALTKFSLTLKQDYEIVKERFFYLLDVLERIFSLMGYRTFSEDDFLASLEPYFPEKQFRKQLARYVLSAFSGRTLGMGKIEENAFLQRREYGDITYLVFNQSYKTAFSNMKRILTKMFEGTDYKSVTRFFSNENDYSITYSRLGSLMEMVNMATYEMKGGDNPMIYIRLNDPERIRKDSENANFKNELLTRTAKRHEISNEIFDHFFTNTFTSDERWDYIEEFFLGATNEELFEQFPEKDDRNHTDIIKYIVDNVKHIEHKKGESKKDGSLGDFPPREGDQYFKENLLTIEGRTMSVEKWVNADPVSFDMVRRKYHLKISKEIFQILMSKLRVNHREYYKDAVGLNMPIEFKGYQGKVPASIPYSNDPVGFYKWWKKAENADKLTMSKAETIRLLIKVYQMDPGALLSKHKKMITN